MRIGGWGNVVWSLVALEGKMEGRQGEIDWETNKKGWFHFFSLSFFLSVVHLISIASFLSPLARQSYSFFFFSF